MTVQRSHDRPQPQPARPDELPSASPSLSDRNDRGQDGRFAPGNTLARLSKVRGPNATSILDKGDPLYRSLARWGRRYAARRRTELAALHGGRLSAGVSIIVESEARALVASRQLEIQGAEAGDADLLKKAAGLACDARQHSLASWELAAREAAVRPPEPFDIEAALGDEGAPA